MRVRVRVRVGPSRSVPEWVTAGVRLAHDSRGGVAGRASLKEAPNALALTLTLTASLKEAANGIGERQHPVARED